MENSLDAGGASDRGGPREGGVRRMRVVDDGGGIERDDLPLASRASPPARFARSRTLERAATLGFRGEALASIGCRRAAGDRQRAPASATRGASRARRPVSAVEPAALAARHRVDVEDLYFNTPARRKFLKSEATEFARCDEAFSRIALSRPAVAFSLAHNGRRSRTCRPRPRAPARRAWSAPTSRLRRRGAGREARLALAASPPRPASRAHSRRAVPLRERPLRARQGRAHAIREAYADVLHHDRHPAYVCSSTSIPRWST
jgi:DNA mismatch repair protein MutL